MVDLPFLINELPILYHEKELTAGIKEMAWLFDDVIVWSEVRL